MMKKRRVTESNVGFNQGALAGIKFLLTSLLILLGSCTFLIGPNKPAGETGGGGEGNLVINLGTSGAGRAIVSGVDLPDEVLAALRYDLILTGPGGITINWTVSAGDGLNLTIATGEWRIEAAAYYEGVPAGTGTLVFTVVPGINPVWIPMTINQG
jgi:hypothetical protein